MNTRTWWRIRVTWKAGHEFEYDTWTDPGGADIDTLLEHIRGWYAGPDVLKVEALPEKGACHGTGRTTL